MPVTARKIFLHDELRFNTMIGKKKAEQRASKLNMKRMYNPDAWMSVLVATSSQQQCSLAKDGKGLASKFPVTTQFPKEKIQKIENHEPMKLYKEVLVAEICEKLDNLLTIPNFNIDIKGILQECTGRLLLFAACPLSAAARPAAEERSFVKSAMSIVYTRHNITQKRRTNDEAPFPAVTASCPSPATLARTNSIATGDLCFSSTEESAPSSSQYMEKAQEASSLNRLIDPSSNLDGRPNPFSNLDGPEASSTSMEKAQESSTPNKSGEEGAPGKKRKQNQCVVPAQAALEPTSAWRCDYQAHLALTRSKEQKAKKDKGYSLGMRMENGENLAKSQQQIFVLADSAEFLTDQPLHRRAQKSGSGKYPSTSRKPIKPIANSTQERINRAGQWREEPKQPLTMDVMYSSKDSRYFS
uniref:Uncharacterized protein n=1 Tax=Oryza punctata TaxID=4537 RepID=A0A0E0JIX0_ORYPU